MIFADAEYYQYEYLGQMWEDDPKYDPNKGRAEIIPFTEFEFWARKASERINRRKVDIFILPEYLANFDLYEIPDFLANCTCAVAEEYFLDSEKQFMAMSQAQSESVGSYSKGAAKDLRQPQQSVESKITAIIADWLESSVLHNHFVFRGVR